MSTESGLPVDAGGYLSVDSRHNSLGGAGYSSSNSSNNSQSSQHNINYNSNSSSNSSSGAFAINMSRRDPSSAALTDASYGGLIQPTMEDVSSQISIRIDESTSNFTAGFGNPHRTSLSSSPSQSAGMFSSAMEQQTSVGSGGGNRSWFLKQSTSGDKKGRASLYDKEKPSKPATGGLKTTKSIPHYIERDVLLTPLHEIPGKSIRRYYGPLLLHFVKDSWNGSKSDQTIEEFTLSFVDEVTTIAMAHVSALGIYVLLLFTLLLAASIQHAVSY